jgi:hypothetical protein
MTPCTQAISNRVSLAMAGLVAMGAAAPAESIQVVTASGAAVTLYGVAQLDASWENHRAGPAPGNLAYWAETGRASQSGEWNFTGSNTKLGLNISGPDSGKPYKLAGKVELDFSGAAGTENTPVPRLRLGYGTFAIPGIGLSVLAGQNWDVIAPLNAPTINTGALWFGGNFGYRRPQVRVTETVALPSNGKMEIAAAVARSIGVASPFVATSSDGGHDADIPVFQGRAAVSFPLWVERQSATLGVSGHFGQEDVLLDTNNSGANYKTLDSWSANLDLELPLAGFVSLVGEGFYGANLDAYQGGINQGITKMGTSVVSVEGWGGWAALKFKIGPTLNVNAGLGVDSVHASTINNGGKTRNVNAFVNTSYFLAPNSRVGIELERIETDYKAGTCERLWRSQAVYAYTF